MLAHAPIRPYLVLGFAALALALVAACGGDEGSSVSPAGALTDPTRVPYATPWPQPPEPIFLEEGALKPTVPGEGQEETGGGGTYTVEPGDSPSSICEKLGCDYRELMELNGIIDPTKLQVGQKLKIPPTQQSEP